MIYNIMKTVKFIVRLLLFVILFPHSLNIVAGTVPPLIWDMSDLEKLKLQQNDRSEIIRKADDFCRKEPLTVVSKQKTFAPNLHFYCSVGPYWWPDDFGNYYPKDGIVNPESYLFDSSILSELAERCTYLSKAFFITENNEYYDTFVTQLKSWFVEKETYMMPNFEYAQVIPGKNNNKGRSTGMIDAYYFNTVIESIRLVGYVKKIDRRTLRTVKKWFKSFVEWSETTYGNVMKEGIQNISIAYDVTMTNMLLFSGKNKLAKAYVNSFAERRLFVQIKEDGSQPEELKRTKAFFYSLYNLSHMLDFCYLAIYFDKDFYLKYGERINQAFIYLEQFINKPESFPYQQITSWDDCKRYYNDLYKRCETLKVQMAK